MSNLTCPPEKSATASGTPTEAAYCGCYVSAQTCPDKGETCDPNAIIDERFQGLESNNRLHLTGARGCELRRFPKDQVGFVVQDGINDGVNGPAIVTPNPRVPLTYHESFLRGGDGSILMNGNEPVRGDVPAFDSLNITINPEGDHRRVKGKPGVVQELEWDGSGWNVITKNPGTDIKEFEEAQSNICDVWDAVIIRQQITEVVGGRCVPTIKAKLGYRPHFMIPYGTIVPWTGGQGVTLPEGWFACNGQALAVTDYPEFFAVIGYKYGGSGALFHVPDTRGYFLRGWDQGAGIDPDAAGRTALLPGGNSGDSVGSYQGSALAYHGHDGTGADSQYSISVSKSSTTIGPNGVKTITYVDDVTLNPTSSDAQVCEIVACDGNPLPDTSTESRPPNVYVDYIIFGGCLGGHPAPSLPT